MKQENWKQAMDKWNSKVKTIDCLISEIGSPCGFCFEYKQSVSNQSDCNDCPLYYEFCPNEGSVFNECITKLIEAENFVKKMRDKIASLEPKPEPEKTYYVGQEFLRTTSDLRGHKYKIIQIGASNQFNFVDLTANYLCGFEGVAKDLQHITQDEMFGAMSSFDNDFEPIKEEQK